MGLASCELGSMPTLSPAELASLAEMGTGLLHKAIPASHTARLLELALIYGLLGDLRITKAGRLRLLVPPFQGR
jgi:hypothetical protein